MTFTIRRESQEQVGHRGWLDTGDGGPLLNCTLVNIDQSGAKLSIDEAEQIPETFSLWLTRYGYPRVSCRTVWRSSNMLGVTFAKAVNEMACRL